MVRDIAHLKTFMEAHVYAVWDFMCLAKTLQSHIAPTNKIWTPRHTPSVRLINEIILAEESDTYKNTHLSHFEIYLIAMKEVGADTSIIEQFLQDIPIIGVHQALQNPNIPASSREFVTTTLSFLDQPAHIVASAFTYGRELIIPELFISILNDLEIEAPAFRYYLSRHIHIDSEQHGPASIDLLHYLCDSEEKLQEVNEAKHKAIEARNKLWREIYDV
jgi:hypothetical protein